MNNKKCPPRRADTSHFDNSRILHECQVESFYNIEPQKRCRKILEALGDNEMTARQIAYKLGFFDLNAVKPRLSEMVQAGIVEVTGKAYDSHTKRKVSIYRRVQ